MASGSALGRCETVPSGYSAAVAGLVRTRAPRPSQGLEDRSRGLPTRPLAQLHGDRGPGQPTPPVRLVDRSGDLDAIERAADPGAVIDDLGEKRRARPDERQSATGHRRRVHQEVGSLRHRDDPERHDNGIPSGAPDRPVVGHRGTCGRQHVDGGVVRERGEVEQDQVAAPRRS